jgi:aminopeptidase YwaD
MSHLFVGAALLTMTAVAAPLFNAPQDQVDQGRLMATIRQLPTSRAALGDQAGREGLRKTESLLTDKLKELGYTPKIEEFKWAIPARNWDKAEAPKQDGPGGDTPRTPEKTDSPGAPQAEPEPQEHTWHNIVVEVPGRERPDEVVLVGAHFDAVPGAPGADDNGTGTAALLEIARVLKDHPTKRTIRLVFFNLEECGLIGSSAYVRSARHNWKAPQPAEGQPPAKPKEKIVGMMSLEMLGYFTDAPNSQQSPIPPIKDVFEPPTVGDSIAVVGLARDKAFIQQLTEGMGKAAPDLKITTVDFMPVPIPDMTRSDHRAFMIAGVPAVMITDTANFRNPNYHKPTDTVETIDAKRYTLVVKAVAGAAYQLAEPETAP